MASDPDGVIEVGADQYVIDSSAAQTKPSVSERSPLMARARQPSAQLHWSKRPSVRQFWLKLRY